MKRINKIFSTKHSVNSVMLFVLFFLFLNTGKELFHNHKHDIIEHDDCPVFILNQILSSGIFSHFEISNDLTVKSYIIILQIVTPSQSNDKSILLRGPPVS